MRLGIVATVFGKELRETLRDRRSMLVMFGMPLLLWPLLALGVYSLAGSKHREMAEKVVRVAVHGGQDAPQLVALLRAEPHRFTIVQPPDARGALAGRSVDAVLVVPGGAQGRALAGEDVQITVQLDRSRTEGPLFEKRLERLLDEYERWIIQQRLAARGVEVSVLKPLKRHVEDVASESQRLGKVLAMMLPNVLLLTGMLGAFFPALNATTTEREAGTLETLLVTPAGRMELLAAKALLVLLSSLATSALNLVSMSLVLWRALSSINATGVLPGALTISPQALGLAYLAAVPALVFFSALAMVVGLMARNFREANSYATPVMLLPLISVGVSIAEPKATAGLLVTPVVNTSLIIRDALTGQVSAGTFLLALGASCLYAGLMLSATVRLFGNEQLVNSSWEPLTLRGLHRSRGKRLPALDEALVLFAVSLLLVFYISPSLAGHGLFVLLAVNQIALIAGPALLLAWLGRYAWRATFAWRRAPAAAWIGAACMGIGIAPWGTAWGLAQHYFWPVNTDVARQTEQLILGALKAHPLLTALAVGTLAGVCEELLFRGPIQTALVRRLHLGPALLVGALLFAAAHFDLRGIPVRFGLGVMLGWLVWRTGSIFPAMLAHGCIDATVLLSEAWRQGTTWASAGVGQWARSVPFMVQLGGGAALLVVGVVLLKRTARPQAGIRQ